MTSVRIIKDSTWICAITLLLFGLVIISGCDEDQEEISPEFRKVRSATRITLHEAGRPEEVYTGEKLQNYLDEFVLDTFNPGPEHVRLTHDCIGGEITIGKQSYPLAQCVVGKRVSQVVVEIDMNGDIIRLRQNRE